MQFFLRLSKILFGPSPIPEQIWYLDGVGLVKILDIFFSNNKKHVKYCLIKEKDWLTIEHKTFKSQATLQVPKTLKQLEQFNNNELIIKPTILDGFKNYIREK